jgi:fatty-acyl-CoA synthase
MEFNVAALHESIAERFPERECLVSGSRRFTWRALAERTRRLANLPTATGWGPVASAPS